MKRKRNILEESMKYKTEKKKSKTGERRQNNNKEEIFGESGIPSANRGCLSAAVSRRCEGSIVARESPWK